MKKLILLIVTLFYLGSYAQSSPAERVKLFNTSSGIAIKGYDPVAYFVSNMAIKGSPEISSNYKGITYLFSSIKDKALFDENPSKYEPQYGGWCAYALGSSGEKVDINPKTFKISNGKLYLFYNAYFNNTLKSWNKDAKNLQTKADANWKKLI